MDLHPAEVVLSTFLVQPTDLRDFKSKLSFHLQDCSGKKIEVGICSRYVSVYRRTTRINGFSWCKIVRVFYKKRRFFIQLKRERYEQCDTIVGFRLADRRKAKALWKSCIEQHAFFRLGQSRPPSNVSRGVVPFLTKLLSIESCYTLSGGSSR